MKCEINSLWSDLDSVGMLILKEIGIGKIDGKEPERYFNDLIDKRIENSKPATQLLLEKLEKSFAENRKEKPKQKMTDNLMIDFGYELGVNPNTFGIMWAKFKEKHNIDMEWDFIETL